MGEDPQGAGLQRSRRPGPAGATPNAFLAANVHAEASRSLPQGCSTIGLLPDSPGGSSACPGTVVRFPGESIWNTASQGVMSRLGQYALPWGVETPLLPVGAGRYGTALLDLMVGEPVAYTTGSPS
jgi:hypothetical protein